MKPETRVTALALPGKRSLIPFRPMENVFFQRVMMDILSRAALSKQEAAHTGLSMQSEIIAYLIPSFLRKLMGN
ncbi:MAG: hypothetical protein IJI38_10160 [Clostridia bacterium]|nr:hypothetical protein [Clostridia bacterium]